MARYPLEAAGAAAPKRRWELAAGVQGHRFSRAGGRGIGIRMSCRGSSICHDQGHHDEGEGHHRCPLRSRGRPPGYQLSE